MRSLLCIFSYLAALSLSVAPVASATSGSQEAVGSIVWVGALSDQEAERWKNEKFELVHLPCDDLGSPCTVENLPAQDFQNAPLLVVRNSQPALLSSLLAGEAEQKFTALVLLDPHAPQINSGTSNAAPRFAHFVEQSLDSQSILAARKNITALRRNGHQATLLFLEEGQLHGDKLGDVTFEALLYFAGFSPYSEQVLAVLTAQEVWPTLPPNNRRLLADPTLLNEGTALDALRSTLQFHYRYEPWQLKQWELKSYRAFDLYAYRDRVAPGARYATLRNRLGHIFFLDLDTYAPYGPEIVVQIDDQENMFHFVWFYRTNLMYSWRSEVQNLSAQPLGPFLNFKTALPTELAVPPLMTTALYLNGITFSEDDPLQAIGTHPSWAQAVITKQNKCVYCHQVGTFGARAHHVEALTAQAQGGFGLPLQDYPEDVLRAFLFDQEAAANKVGLTPNPVDPELAEEFFRFVRSLGSSTTDEIPLEE